MTNEEIKKFVEERVTYKPNWTLRVDEDAMSHPYLLINFTTQDAYGVCDQPVQIGRRLRIPDHVKLSEQFLENFLIISLDNMERHESREWFKIDGVMVRDPHKVPPLGVPVLAPSDGSKESLKKRRKQ